MAILRTSFREDVGRRLLDETLRAIERKKPYETIEYLRSLIDEEMVSIQLSYADPETLKNSPVAIVDHSIKKRGRVISDYDSSAANGNATQDQFKGVHEHLGVPMEELTKEFVKLAGKRAEFSKKILTLDRTAENISVMRQSLQEQRYAWQDFYSFVLNGKDAERLSMAIEEYSVKLIKNPERYFDSRIIDLPPRLRSIGVETMIASQNQFAWIAPALFALGFNNVIANHIPEVKNGKIKFPDSSHPIKIVSSADKHGIIKRLKSYISRVFKKEEMQKADFFSSIESDAFGTDLGTDYKMPLIGSQRTYLVESRGEYAGDVLQTLSGMFKPSDFDIAFLLEDKEGPFSHSGKMGSAAEKFFSKERTQIVPVKNADEISNFIASMTIYHDQFTRSVGTSKLIEILKLSLHDESKIPMHFRTRISRDRLADAIRKMEIWMEGFEFIVEKVESTQGIKIPRTELVGEKKNENTYAIVGLSQKLDENESRARLLSGIPQNAFGNVKLQKTEMETGGTEHLMLSHNSRMRIIKNTKGMEFFINNG